MNSLLDVQTGFQTIEADESIKRQALENLSKWLSLSEYRDYVPQIQWMIKNSKWSLLLDSFYQVLPFGTGGRRGAVGIGPNRMNLWTLGASVQGHCDYLRQRFPGKSQIKVVLAYDVRKFTDQRNIYNPDLPNPVLGMTSRNFCEFAAGVYAANGIESWILPPDARRYVSTPELSFTIRFLNADGGLNMTASHNPPDDNGSKFYDERGAQPVPPEDQLMSEMVDQIDSIQSLTWHEAVQSGKVKYLDQSPHDAYIELCRKQSLIPQPRVDELRVVFTPLQGVGGGCAGEVLEKQGFRPIPVPEQNEPNGLFTNITKTPNPEVPECLDRAERVATEHHADLVIATDPDADRLGGLVCTSVTGNGFYRFLHGQEIASLLTYFKLSRLANAGDLPASPIVITTEVTTGQITAIARHFGSQVVNDLLVGFKYHADVLWQLESTGQFGDIRGSTSDFVIATEESHGVLATAELRDKDSACAALLLAELSLHLKRQGRTIPELIDELSRKFGYYKNELRNLIMTGVEGKRDMITMLDSLRNNPPESIDGMAVGSFEDLQSESGRMGPFKGETDRLARNFLIFRLSDNHMQAKVCLRPSGTEPKAKAYLELMIPPPTPHTTQEQWNEQKRRVDSKMQSLADAFLERALSAVKRP